MRRALVPFLLILGAGVALAEQVPTFPVSQDASRSTHVIVAKKDGPGGAILVQESLKGDLKPGDKLTVPFLAIFDDPKERTVIYPTWAEERNTTLTGDRMYVFLRRSTSGQWNSASAWDDIARIGSRPSFVWVEKDKVFGHQRGNGYLTPQPGAVRVEYFYGFENGEPATEGDLRKVLFATIGGITSIETVNAIPDKAKRAEALGSFIGVKLNDISEAAFESLVACGEAAIPVLDRVLADEARFEVHFVAVHSLARIGDADIDPVLVKVVEREAAFIQAWSRETS